MKLQTNCLISLMFGVYNFSKHDRKHRNKILFLNTYSENIFLNIMLNVHISFKEYI